MPNQARIVDGLTIWEHPLALSGRECLAFGRQKSPLRKAEAPESVRSKNRDIEALGAVTRAAGSVFCRRAVSVGLAETPQTLRSCRTQELSEFTLARLDFAAGK
jgi:hypothetical protein